MDIDRAKEIYTDRLIESTFQDAEPETYKLGSYSAEFVELEQLPENERFVDLVGAKIPIDAFCVDDCSVVQDQDGEATEIDWSALCFRVSVEIPEIDKSKVLDQRMCFHTEYVLADIDYLSDLQELYLTSKLMQMWRDG